MVPEPTEGTKGKVLNRLEPNQLDLRLAAQLQTPPSGLKSLTTTEFQASSLESLEVKTKINSYEKGDSVVITFDTATDNPIGDPRLQGTTCPRCSEVFKYMQTDAFKDAIRDKKPPVHVYLPIITVYGIPRHEHYRGISLDVSLDSNGDVKADKARLINSRNAFFGRFCPDGVKKEIKERFGCECESVFTGQQSTLKGDNDSCGYRAVSYGVQLANGADSKALRDDVNCKTKTTFFNFLPKLISAGIDRLFFKKPPPLSPKKESNATSDGPTKELGVIVETMKRSLPTAPKATNSFSIAPTIPSDNAPPPPEVQPRQRSLTI